MASLSDADLLGVMPLVTRNYFLETSTCLFRYLFCGLPQKRLHLNCAMQNMKICKSFKDQQNGIIRPSRERGVGLARYIYQGPFPVKVIW